LIEAARQTAKIADSVTIGILEAPNEDFVEDSVRPPRAFDRRGRRRAGSWRRVGGGLGRGRGAWCGGGRAERDRRLAAGRQQERQDKGDGRDAATPSEVSMGPHWIEYRIARAISRMPAAPEGL
jgi:hypothetical protein